MKRILAIVISVGLVMVLGIAFLPGFVDKNQSKNAAKDVLDYLIEQDYHKAFENVYYYDKASDLNPTISYDNAKGKWTQRNIELNENGIYLSDYSNLKVDLEDTYPVGKVDIVIVENGEKKVKEDVQLWFGSTEEGWKLGNFDYYLEEEKWEKVWSGYIEG
jgi:hypothetical protein